MTPYMPRYISVINASFGMGANSIAPPMHEIPDVFKPRLVGPSNRWIRIAQAWYERGIQQTYLPKPGIDLDMAIRNLRCVLASCELTVEHRVSATAYLMSQWLDVDVVILEK